MSCDPTTPRLDSTTPPESRNVPHDVIVTGPPLTVTLAALTGWASRIVRHSGRVVGEDRPKSTRSAPACSANVPAPGRAMAHTVKRSNISIGSVTKFMLTPSTWLVRLNPERPSGGDGLD